MPVFTDSGSMISARPGHFDIGFPLTPVLSRNRPFLSIPLTLLDCSPYQSVNLVMAKPNQRERDVRRTIARLPTLPTHELRELWREHFGRGAPAAFRRELLVPFLAYRIQEKAYGGLKRSVLSELRRISRCLDRGEDPTTSSIASRIKTGTRIVRTWQGQAHEVAITESGFEYSGATYRSLSQIARKITGTQWSGPAFFGLKQNSKENKDLR